MEIPRILVIEDDRPTCVLIAALAQHDGMQADLFFDGDQARDALLACNHKAVVLDLLLPGLGGVDLLRALSEQRPDLLGRTIVITAADASLREAARSLGPGILIAKPFDIGELLEAIRHCGAE